MLKNGEMIKSDLIIFDLNEPSNQIDISITPKEEKNNNPDWLGPTLLGFMAFFIVNASL